MAKRRGALRRRGAPFFYGFLALVSPLLPALLPVTATACEAVSGEAGLGQRYIASSELTEYSLNGTTLVKERGALPGWQLGLRLNCDVWSLSAAAFSNDGVRDYNGQTSLGVPLSTASAIGYRGVDLALGWQVTDSIQVVLDAVQQRTNREIASTPLAAGYPETYDRSLVRLGSRWTIPSGFGRWMLFGAMSVGGQQTMTLQLPGKDPTSLVFGTPNQWELGLSWRHDLAKDLYIDVSYRYINTTIDKSDAAIITSSGNPVGVVYQPKTTVVDQPITLSIGFYF